MSHRSPSAHVLQATGGFQREVAVGERGREVLRDGVHDVDAVATESRGDMPALGQGPLGGGRVVHGLGVAPATRGSATAATSR